VDAIFGDHSILSAAPTDFFWSPNGEIVAYLATDSQTVSSGDKAAPGDLISIDANTGRSRILAMQSQLAVLSNPNISEQDFDHRARYDMPSIIWSPDAKSLLLDAAGSLYLYDIAHARPRLLNASQASGDDPKFSPDGKFISYIRAHGLYLQSLEDQKEFPIAVSPDHKILNGEADWVYLEELNVRSNYFWSPDSNRIAYLQMNESRVPSYPIPDYQTTHTTTFQQPYPQPGDPNPDVRIGTISLRDTNHTHWLTLPFSRGNDYIPRFGWLNKKTLWIEVVERNQQHLHVYLADADSDQVAEIYNESDTKFLDINYDFTFLQNGQFIRSSWRDGHTHLYLYSYDEKSPLSAPANLVRQLTSGNYDVESLLGISNKEKSAFYVSNDGNPLGRQLWSVPLSGGAPLRLTSGPGTHVISLSPDRGSFIDTDSTVTAPEKICLCHINSECKTLWSARNPRIQPPTELTLKAADNTTTLYGWLSLPSETTNASVPLVLNPYGGPGEQGVRDIWNGEDELFNQLIAQHGIAVLSVDNRGMAMRGRDFAQAAYHNLGAVQLADQMAALDQVLARYPQLDHNRLGFWGWSYGGYFTLYALSHTDHFRTGIAVAPVTDWRLYDSIYTERYLGLPSLNAEIYKADGVLNSASNLHGHLLLIHGTGDDNVHLQNTFQYIQALINVDKRYDLQLFPRKTHSILGTDVQTQLYNRILHHLETDLN